MQPSRPTAAPRRRVALASLLVALAALLVACGDLVEVQPHEPVTLPTPDQNSVVVDAQGNTLAELHAGQDREVVALSQLPEALIDAVVAIEDHRYWSHHGVDAPSVLRALGVNIRAGDIVQGGSTITQQLAKIALVGSEQSLQRKAVEASVALQLESRFSKREILAQYLNTVYFGQGAYGAQSAAQRYFGVDASQLDLGQAATLAGTLRAPSRDNPLTDPAAARARRDAVLQRMVELGHIDAQQAATASAGPVEVSPRDPRPWQAPYFVAHALKTIQHDDAFTALGDDPDERARRLYRGGLRIETTLDPDWQTAAEDAVATTLSDDGDPHAAVVAIEPGTGALRALIGGRGRQDPDDPVARLNLATKARRQPGSAFKPLTLAAALTRGHSLDESWSAPASLTLPADPPAHPNAWTLSNYGDAAFGRLDLRQATWHSVNTVYGQLVQSVGASAVADLAERAGVGRSLPAVRSIGLGSVEVTPLEMARVNATLAAGGVRRETRVVSRIVGPNGRVLWEPAPSGGSRVMDRGVAWMTTQALRGVITEGTGQVIDLDRPVAGKTGTTNDYADAWFAGYTPDMALSVWVGFPQGRVPMVPPRTRRRVAGGTWPAEIFDRTVSQALAAAPPSEFPVPRGSLATVEVDASRDCLANPYTPPDLVERHMYLAGTQPSEPCDEPSQPPAEPVPDVLGMPAESAVAELRRAGFSARVATECPDGGDDCPGARRRPGTVWQQQPSETAPADSAIELSVHPRPSGSEGASLEADTDDAAPSADHGQREPAAGDGEIEGAPQDDVGDVTPQAGVP
ncbi:MAG: twin-arginine translocation pathway signal protein [Actinobacteria bacterium QS_8_72_14]|nr:MAG: twin-arginine translocation pathway signal protein [Actinobacteria bacterium QS_8_72_14]